MSTTAPFETILYEKDGTDKFATITLNRPDKLNAMNKTTVREIDRAVAMAVADPDVNALVITGAGRAFSSGYDLQGADYDVDIESWQADMTENAQALLNIWKAPIPVIASINGYALAGALELMMSCDLAIAADNAKFGEPEVRHNSGPPALFMPWLLSTRDTRWLMYTGDLVDAAAHAFDQQDRAGRSAEGKDREPGAQAGTDAGSRHQVRQGLDQQPAGRRGPSHRLRLQCPRHRCPSCQHQGPGVDAQSAEDVAEGISRIPRCAVQGPRLIPQPPRRDQNRKRV
jgi:Enoyl-CoA hydratase/isomerase